MSNKKTVAEKKNKKGLMIVAAVVLAAVLVPSFILSGMLSGTQKSAAVSSAGSGITINKSDITEKATFIPYEAGSTHMEIVAVRASDGTIRTALNTCQVCYDSGKGYYVQEGDELVCQNCGNRFKIDQVEKEKNGCNPVPILSENKTEDEGTISISAAYLEANKAYFSK